MPVFFFLSFFEAKTSRKWDLAMLLAYTEENQREQNFPPTSFSSMTIAQRCPALEKGFYLGVAYYQVNV